MHHALCENIFQNILCYISLVFCWISWWHIPRGWYQHEWPTSSRTFSHSPSLFMHEFNKLFLIFEHMWWINNQEGENMELHKSWGKKWKQRDIVREVYIMVARRGTGERTVKGSNFRKLLNIPDWKEHKRIGKGGRRVCRRNVWSRCLIRVRYYAVCQRVAFYDQIIFKKTK